MFGRDWNDLIVEKFPKTFLTMEQTIYIISDQRPAF